MVSLLRKQWSVCSGIWWSVCPETGGQFKLESGGQFHRFFHLSLTNGEFLQFQRYIENVKFAGTDITVTTLNADVISYDIIVYYDPAYLPEGVNMEVLKRLESFRLELGFDGLFYSSDFVKAILEVTGVKTVKVNSLTGTQGITTVAIDVSYSVEAGYFNFGEDSVIAMQNARQ